MNTILLISIRAGLVLLLWMPLIITPSTLQPFGVGKALYARVVIEVVTGLWLLLLIRHPAYRPPRSRILLLFAGYVIVAFVSAVQGESFTHSLWSDYFRMLGVWDLLHWFILVVVAASVLRSPRDWLQLLNWNLGVGLVLSSLALVRTYTEVDLPYLTHACRVQVTLGNPSYLAAILVVTTLVAVGLLARSLVPTQAEENELSHSLAGGHGKRPPIHWLRAFWVITAVTGLLVVFHTGTRGALVGLVAGAVTMPVALVMWGNRKALRPVALAAGGILVAIVLLFAVEQTVGFPLPSECRGQTASERLTSTTVEQGGVASRLMAAEAGLKGFLERPLLGWGPENFERAWEKLANPSSYKYGQLFFDKAHNKVVEELATKGVLGTLFYLGLWVALVLALVRRRRPPREEILAYAVLGALTWYFVQNLFLFDVPPTMLQWALLVAWVAGERLAPGASGVPPERPGSSPPRRISSPWVMAGFITATVVILGLSTYFLNYRPYAAAHMLGDAHRQHLLADRLVLAQSAFDTFPPLANWARRLVFGELNDEWIHFTPDERRLALQFVLVETDRAIRTEPRDPLLLRLSLSIFQLSNPTAEGAQVLQPIMDRIVRLAPQRVYTIKLLARQALMKGSYREAISIIEDYEAIAPWTVEHFTKLKQSAQDALADAEHNIGKQRSMAQAQT